MKSYLVSPLELKTNAYELCVPSSKSLANRVFILAAQSEGNFTIRGDFNAEDVQLMINALKALGIDITHTGSGVQVQNDLSWMKSFESLEIFLGNSGTCIRFLLSLVPLRAGNTILTGKQRIKERPISDLVDSLRQLGVEIRYLEAGKFPPLEVHSLSQSSTAEVSIRGDVSSQFLSSLLLSSPSYPSGMHISLASELISRPYVALTVDLMTQWGIDVSGKDDGFVIHHHSLVGRDFEVEGDASAAVYWWGLGFLHDVTVHVVNVPDDSLQGDLKFLDVLKHLSDHDSSQEFSIDMNDLPDASLMLMALAPVLDFPVRVSGIGSLRVKETDRIAAMMTELTKLGVVVRSGDDWMSIQPLSRDAQLQHEIEIDTYDDHRIAMSMAILGTRVGHLRILDPDCVNKTYPNFWKDLKSFS